MLMLTVALASIRDRRSFWVIITSTARVSTPVRVSSSLTSPGGSRNSTAITASASMARTVSTGMFCTMPPSASTRPLISTGVNTPGIAMEARTAWDNAPSRSTTPSPLNMSVATHRNGMGKSSKLAAPDSGNAMRSSSSPTPWPELNPLGPLRPCFRPKGAASFDDLPIPFRCVATDMLSGEGVVLRDCALSQAVRASMAIPGVFTPVEINGRVLADGGMVQNIPVETVLAMDADAVIAVELRLPPGDVKELETLTGVLTRAVDVMITQNERRSLMLARATVSISMAGFDATDYSRVKELVDLGYKSAASQSTNLLPYAIRDPAPGHDKRIRL